MGADQGVRALSQVPLPDVRGRAEILTMYLKDKPVAPDVDVMRLARATPGTHPERGPLGALICSIFTAPLQAIIVNRSLHKRN